jgi:hypothetical protein
MQVCVPSNWTNEQIEHFANADTPCGTEGGWKFRKKESYTDDSEERVNCISRGGFIHAVLDA